VPGLGKGSVGGFVEELHGAGAEPPQHFKGYRAERISGARVVHVIVPGLFNIPQSHSVAMAPLQGCEPRSEGTKLRGDG
jgi:hypothetical protein